MRCLLWGVIAERRQEELNREHEERFGWYVVNHEYVESNVL